MKIELHRIYEKDCVRGLLETPFGNFKTLELPWKDNTEKVSCIPEGKYIVFKDKFNGGRNAGKRAFRFHNVPNRSGILFHIGNWTREIQGCILVGMKYDEKRQMIKDSTIAFNLMWKYLPDVFKVEIKEDVTDFAFFSDYKQLELESKVKPNKEPKKSLNRFIVPIACGLLGVSLLKMLK